MKALIILISLFATLHLSSTAYAKVPIERLPHYLKLFQDIEEWSIKEFSNWFQNATQEEREVFLIHHDKVNRAVIDLAEAPVIKVTDNTIYRRVSYRFDLAHISLAALLEPLNGSWYQNYGYLSTFFEKDFSDLALLEVLRYGGDDDFSRLQIAEAALFKHNKSAHKFALFYEKALQIHIGKKLPELKGLTSLEHLNNYFISLKPNPDQYIRVLRLVAGQRSNMESNAFQETLRSLLKSAITDAPSENVLAIHQESFENYFTNPAYKVELAELLAARIGSELLTPAVNVIPKGLCNITMNKNDKGIIKLDKPVKSTWEPNWRTPRTHDANRYDAQLRLNRR